MDLFYEIVKNIRSKCPTLKCRELKTCADAYICKWLLYEVSLCFLCLFAEDFY